MTCEVAACLQAVLYVAVLRGLLPAIGLVSWSPTGSHVAEYVHDAKAACYSSELTHLL